MKAFLGNYEESGCRFWVFKRTRAREEIQALAQRRRVKIILARSAFLDDVFPLAQEGMPFLFCIYDEHNHYCSQCYGKKYFHAPRIARTSTFVLCRRLTNTKQKCKCIRLFKSFIIVKFNSLKAMIQYLGHRCGNRNWMLEKVCDVHVAVHE